jgi:hypothetical protein
MNDIAVQLEHGEKGAVDGEVARYVLENLEAAGKQQLTVEEAESILETNRFINRSIGSLGDTSRRGAAIKRIREVSGVALVDLKKQISEKESNRTPAGDIEEFKLFADRHDGLGRPFFEGNDQGLENFIYHTFYSGDGQGKYKSGTPQFETLKTQSVAAFSESFLRLHKEAGAIDADRPRLKMNGNGYWTYAEVGNGLSGFRGPIGRIYLNIAPQELPSFFEEFVKQARDRNVNVETKIPAIFSGDQRLEEKFNRRDKMLVYFAQENDSAVMEIIDGLYVKNKHAFVDDTPRFTTPVNDEKGMKMPGVAFGEEPINHRSSFGEIRSLILAKVWEDARTRGLSVSDPEFDFKSSLDVWSERYGVDSNEFSFNARTSKQFAFKSLRKRISN